MSDFNEAVVLIAKCGESHKTYGMRLEKTGHDRWLFHLQMTIPDVLIAVATG